MMTLIAAALTFFAALCTRWYLNRSSRRDTRHFHGHVILTAVWNKDAAFALPISRKVVTAVSFVTLAAAWCQRRTSRLGAGLVMGGGFANLYERLCHERVYDYVRFPKAPGRWKNYVYNLADFAIGLGALLFLFRRKKR